jgi:hypothetical protein
MHGVDEAHRVRRQLPSDVGAAPCVIHAEPGRGGRRPSFVRGHSAAFDREHGRELGKPGCAPFLEKSVE